MSGLFWRGWWWRRAGGQPQPPSQRWGRCPFRVRVYSDPSTLWFSASAPGVLSGWSLGVLVFGWGGSALSPARAPGGAVGTFVDLSPPIARVGTPDLASGQRGSGYEVPFEVSSPGASHDPKMQYSASTAFLGVDLGWGSGVGGWGSGTAAFEILGLGVGCKGGGRYHRIGGSEQQSAHRCFLRFGVGAGSWALLHGGKQHRSLA